MELNFSRKALPVAVLFGGVGCEREISAQSASNVIRLIKNAGYEVLPVGIASDGSWYIYRGDTFSSDMRNWDKNPNLLTATYPVRKRGAGGENEVGFAVGEKTVPILSAIPVLHGDFGEDGVIQGALEAFGMDFLGCRTSGGAISSDKATSKLLAELGGIPTVPWILFLDERESIASDGALGRVAFDIDSAVRAVEGSFGYPAFVKPAGLGSSFGASSAKNRGELISALRTAGSFSGRILIEKMLERKRELEVACIARPTDEWLITPPGEIAHKSEFYDYETKYCGAGESEIFPVAKLSQHVAQKLRDHARKIISLLGVRHLARVDFFLDGDGNIYFNEINTFPGFTEISLFPRMLNSCGIGDAELARLLVELSRGKRA